MFGPKSVVRLRAGIMLIALAVTLSVTVQAQWWGPYGHPLRAAPGVAAPPVPPSVGEFMSNPGLSAAATMRSGAGRPDVCRGQAASAPTYYVIGPGMAAYVLRPTGPGRCVATAKADSDEPAHREDLARETTDPSQDTGIEQPQADPDAPTTTVAAQETASGKILVDDAGMTLYVSGSDPVGRSSCYADCARNWPPATAPDDARTDGDLAVIARNDGSRQWAFKGRPLYRWAGDKQPGDTKGHGLGSAWAVARTDLKP